ncbi:MAG: DUF456 family protein [Nitrospirales bacterium]
MDTTILLWVLASLLVLMGVVGTVVPALPGPTFVFAGLVVAAWAEDFSYIGRHVIIILAVLTVLTFFVDFVASAFGAKRVGASMRAIVGASIGAVVGLFFGILGLLLGPFVGAVLGELTVRGSLTQAGRAGFGTWIGMLFGVAGKLALVFSMLAIFVWARFL